MNCNDVTWTLMSLNVSQKRSFGLLVPRTSPRARKGIAAHGCDGSMPVALTCWPVVLGHAFVVAPFAELVLAGGAAHASLLTCRAMFSVNWIQESPWPAAPFPASSEIVTVCPAAM